MRRIVDLPEPEPPTSTSSSPSATSRSKSSTTMRVAEPLAHVLEGDGRHLSLDPRAGHALDEVRCRNTYAITTGTTSTIAEASETPTEPAPPPSANTVSSCGSVISCCSRTTSSGQSTSFHDPMKVKIATMESTGLDSGQKIVKRIRSSLIPSMRAESMSDCGIWRKNCRSIRIAVALNRYGTMSAAYVSIQPSCTISV